MKTKLDFHTGDHITGMPGVNRYGRTNQGMIDGLVLNESKMCYDGTTIMEIKIINHINPSFIGEKYRVINSHLYFQLLNDELLDENIRSKDELKSFILCG